MNIFRQTHDSRRILWLVRSHLLLAVLAWPGAPVALAGGVVNNCTEADLRAAMAGGGTVTFACEGTITLAKTITNTVDTVLDGTGHQVTISGSNAVRLFSVTTNFTVADLTLADGFSSRGSAILIFGGNVTLTGVTLRTNVASTAAPYEDWPPGAGGALCNLGGAVGATNCSFVGNEAYSRWGDFASTVASGGAIHNQSGGVNLERCAFVGNAALGGPALHVQTGGTGASGGAICNQGALAARACTFTNNSALGGDSTNPEGYPGGYGGWARGGAVFNAIAATATADRSTFAGNRVRGGNGAQGYTGPVVNYYGQPGGTGGYGGLGDAGALFNSGTASLINCTIVGNQGVGGSGGPGGPGGGLAQGPAQFGGPGGKGGNGGNGFGGVDGTCALTNCTLALNVGVGGEGGAGGPGGIGLYGNGGTGLPGTNGNAYGGTVCTNLVNSLIASNTPAGNDSFPDPKLGPLADNGGPTLTMALLPGSPAIDAADTATAPPTDQRGFPRPAGAAADIGAFEYGSMLPMLAISCPAVGQITILVQGDSNQWCRLLSSSNLSSWLPIATNQIGSDGTFVFHDNCSASCRFYRAVIP